MADVSEHLATIARLRAEARVHEDAVHRAGVGLQKARQRLGRAEQRQTIPSDERDRDVSSLRLEMDRLNARLNTLREDARDVASALAAIAEQRRLLQQLERNLVALRKRVAALRERLAELEQQDAPQEQELARLRAELEALLNSERELLDGVAQMTRRMREEAQREQALRDRQAETERAMESLRADLRGTQGRIIELQAPTVDDRQAIDAQIASLAANAERSRAASNRATRELSSAISGLYATDRHPRVPVSRLDDRTPFLLFPMRIETIFAPVTSQDGQATPELRVRVYPDDIAVHTHEDTLTDREIDAGALYWVELLVAAHLRSEQSRRQRAAWRFLVDLYGGQRAAWVARQTRPSDWETLSTAAATQSLIAFLQAADATFFTALAALPLTASVRAALAKLVAAQDGDAFIRLVEEQKWGERLNVTARAEIAGFPVHDVTKTDAWSRAPRTTVLPDRFVLLLYSSVDAPPRELVGELIPDTVAVGPDPLDPKDALVAPDGTRTLGGACEWMSNFNVAVAQGLAFRVPLSADEARNGFARIIVLGLRLSATPEHSATSLAELIASHQFSPKGFSLVPQGSPTNNTETNGTGYSDNDPYDELAFFTELDAPAFDPSSADPLKSRTDGRLLADALGVAYSALERVQQADQTDVLEACAMNTALFPSTLGYWLTKWMSPVVTPDAARLTRTFFTKYVTGRGPLPAIRVGNQPYGVLVTSDMSRWKYPKPLGPLQGIALFDEMTPYLTRLHDLLAQLENEWNTLAADALYVGKPGSDPSDVLMNVLGLHPTSVEFFQRVGFSAEYLKVLDSFMQRQSYANELASLLMSGPPIVRNFLKDLGVDETIGTVGKMLAMHVLWQHYVSALDAPVLVDYKPSSETSPLSSNYIEWLAAATDTNAILRETFSATKPTALLYAMLRNALLLQLHKGSYEWLRGRSTFEPELERSLLATSLPGMSAVANVSRLELMAVQVEAAQPSHPAPGTSVADWIWKGPPPAEAEAAFVGAQRAALEQLAQSSTASLERCLVEHLDVCHYRLDAWVTGLFAQRLDTQRKSGGAPQSRATGIHLGAFGWVENVRPVAKTFLRPADLPPTLRPDDQEPLLEEDGMAGGGNGTGSKQGGYMHAPSFSHAAAAALLRNAYLSHANRAEAEILSVNLSSERVRRAQFVLEGMRNGQPIEALLGYQFERGLHDITSASAARGDVPVLELNQFIAPYRRAFPFESREIAQAGSPPATETVPPYSTVNGLKLTTALPSAADGFGLAAVLTAAELPNAAQGAAILGMRDAMRDTLDAVKDLLMAENAYQLVQGNFDRVAAVSLAQKDAQIPPSLEVLNTPRGTQFTFTNRVTLQFEDLDPTVPASNPWTGIDMSPRAIAEPGLNFWLGSVLGRAPGNVRCIAYHVTANDTETRLDPREVTLAELQLQPIDLVALTNFNEVIAQGATELETRIALRYRIEAGVAADQTVRIDFNPPSAATALTFGELLPLARRLRALVGECRTLDAQDFLPAAGGKATTVPMDKSNPKGYDVAQLRARVESARTALGVLADGLDGPAAPSVSLTLLHVADDAADDESFVGSLRDAFAKLEGSAANVEDPAVVTVTLSLLAAEAIATTLREIARFGISDALPMELDLTLDAAKRTLLSRAQRIARRLRHARTRDGVLDRAAAFVAAAKPDTPVSDQVTNLLHAGQAVFGDTVKLMPSFICYNEVDIATADASRAQLLSHAVSAAPGLAGRDVIDEWAQGLARVRPKLHTWELIRILSSALADTTMEMRPVQLPHRDKDSWLAVEFPEKDPLHPERAFGISRDTVSITAHGATAFQAGVSHRGLLVDEWTEEIPTASENTGISFRFNQPNAVPPQTLLLAVTPEETGSWSWDALVGTLNDTLARAKRRAVEPAQLEKNKFVWPVIAPALVSEFTTQAFADISLDLMRVQLYAPLHDFYAKVNG